MSWLDAWHIVQYALISSHRSGSLFHSPRLGLCILRLILFTINCAYNAGATVEVLVNEKEELLGIYFQDEEMKQIFRAYPELVCIDATYKLLELRFPLYILLIEDGNGQSELIAGFLLLEETEVSFTKMMSIFKKHNPSWESTRVLMSDKDLTEREVLATLFPSADLLICSFRSFRREVVVEKMGITSAQRNTSLEMLQQLAYATSEEKYQDLYSRFCACVPSTVVEYFNKNWHPIRQQWTMGMKYSTGNFLNGTNNRLESINQKLKSVISRYSSLEEFVDKFFLILRVLRSERDHKAALVAQKVPVAFHTTALCCYMQFLTPYAYKFVLKRIELKDRVKIGEHADGDSLDQPDFLIASSEGNIHVTASTCECTSWKSMKLPCRHILAVRAKLEVDLFEETLCDRRWSANYFKRSQRIFSCDTPQDYPLRKLKLCKFRLLKRRFCLR